ncbi:hypothetical protein CTAYLR_002074 [Chrysophaeum taylorii]|uniref:RING-type domain-containing protein n=1 Tax=Chrysophaeum taylorii TaxID=2483200 RepID=A0AAD7UPV2_9STRA|nr:hypothetical protein CTAYLR_002074 [Chrysophaeum taylorii]
MSWLCSFADSLCASEELFTPTKAQPRRVTFLLEEVPGHKDRPKSAAANSENGGRPKKKHGKRKRSTSLPPNITARDKDAASEVNVKNPAALVGRSVEIFPEGKVGKVVSFHHKNDKHAAHTIDFGDGKPVAIVLGVGGLPFKLLAERRRSRKMLERKLERTTTRNNILQGNETHARVASERLKKEIDQLRNCPLCSEDASDVAFVPCGHRSCSRCARHILKTHVQGVGRACPVCKDKIRSLLHLS